jgi:hypothetical protein
MTAGTQHDFHPDAEVLNAFAEQALGERERSQVLAHLAVCGQCREVIMLAQQAAIVETAPVVTVAAPIAPRTWWRQWRVVWIPAAVAAAFTVTTVSMHFRQAERSGVTTQIAKQAPASNLIPASAAPPQAEVAETAPPPTPPPAPSAPTRPSVASKAVVPKAVPMPLSAAAAQSAYGGTLAETAPPSETNETVTVSQYQPEIATVPPAQQPSTAQLAPATSPMLYKIPPAVVTPEQQQLQAKRQAKMTEQQKQIEAATVQGHLFAADEALEPSAQIPSSSAPAKAKNSSVSYSQQLEVTAGAAAAVGSIHGASASWNGSLRLIHLPSGLAATSFASSGYREVAIDSSGAVFFSEDYGSTWKPVKPQWTGRAILVRTQTPPRAREAAPAAPTNSDAPVAVPATAPPAPIFEIVNDKNLTWLSTNGTIWIAK